MMLVLVIYYIIWNSLEVVCHMYCDDGS